MKTMTENVATWKVGDVEKKIDALNKKARKLGLPGVTMEKGEEFMASHAADCSCCAGLRSDAWVPMTVSGEAVRIGGWQLVAVLDHGIGDKPVIRNVGDDLPERYRDATPVCDHCGLERRRRDTFVLEHISRAEHRQVGRTCLGDYLGENYTCGNHIVWDVEDVRELRIAHLGFSKDRADEFFFDVQERLLDYSEEATEEMEAKLLTARTTRIAGTKELVLDALFGRVNLSKGMLGAAFDACTIYQDGDPCTYWGITAGVTRVSQEGHFADRRVEIDREAGKILRMAF